MKRGRQPPTTTGKDPAPKAPRMTYDAAAANAAAQGAPYKKLQVEDALAYLDQVKKKFANQPHVYNSFLDIMKEFKAQTIDTPGVIARVSELFKGHTPLILGFNTFLPPGYKIEVPEEEPIPPPQPPPYAQAAMAPYPAPAAHMPPSTLETSSMPVEQPAQASSSAPPQPQPQQPPAGGQAKKKKEKQQKSAIDFDQAINYVTKIKLRFANQPETYKSFLDILHTYQKEQTTIVKVYEQVALLFKDHDDLLEEFTQFLPVPVKEQSTVAALQAKHKADKQAALQQQQLQQQAQQAQSRKKAAKKETQAPAPSSAQQRNRNKQRPEPSKKREKEQEEKTKKGEKAMEQETLDFSGFGAPEKLPAFFERVKQRLRNRETYKQFLKCLNLYSQEVVSQSEMLSLVEDLIGKYPDLFNTLKQIVASSEESFDEGPNYENLKRDAKFGPSYRALPKNYPAPHCSGRNDLCDEVLNNILVSVPAGSEESRDQYKKTQFDEVLFQCEDDRTELDIVIEQNMSTIMFLEPIADKFLTMSPEEQSKYKLEKLRDIHLASIARIYGDRGNDILEGLRRNPVVAIPIIIKRLKQKDEEWRNARRELNKFWREVYEKNNQKSIEIQRDSFKQSDKKALSTKNLVAAIEELHAIQRGMDFKFEDESVHSDIFDIVMGICQTSLNEEGIDKVKIFWKVLVRPFFCLKSGQNKAHSAKEAESNGVKMEVDAQGSAKDGESKTSSSSDASELDNSLLLDVDRNGENGPICMPLIEQSIPSNQSPFQLFFGNTTLYLFVRLYQILYERLHRAKEMADQTIRSKKNAAFVVTQNLNMTVADMEQAMSAQQGASATNATATAGEQTSDAVNQQQPAEGQQQQQSQQHATTDQETAEGNYRKFLELVAQFVDGTLDQQKYEEQAKVLLGDYSYIVFTIDKLLSHLLKQLQNILSEQTCSRLLKAYDYERRRINAFVDNSYSVHAFKIVGDETCYRFEYKPETKELDIFIVDQPEADPEKEVAEEKGFQYVERYISKLPSLPKTSATTAASKSGGAPTKRSKVFMKRSVQKGQKDVEFSRVDIVNGLECKICLATYKMFYVEDTEDYFARKKTAAQLEKRRQYYAKRAAITREQRSNWINACINQASKMPADEASKSVLEFFPVPAASPKPVAVKEEAAAAAPTPINIETPSADHHHHHQPSATTAEAATVPPVSATSAPPLPAPPQAPPAPTAYNNNNNNGTAPMAATMDTTPQHQ